MSAALTPAYAAPSIAAMLASCAPFRACRFCDAAARPGRETCAAHASFDGLGIAACSRCRAPLDRLLGSLATRHDAMCETCEFRSRSNEFLFRRAMLVA